MTYRRVPVWVPSKGRVETQRVRSDRLGTLYGQTIVNAHGKKAWVKKPSEVRALEAVRGRSPDATDSDDDLIELEVSIYYDY